MHILLMFRKIFAISALVMSVSVPAMADEPKVLSAHGDWTAYVFNENGNKVCYMASQPIKAEGAYTKRGDIFALVTHRPGEDSRDVFSYITGYSYKPSSNVSLSFGSKKFTLFTQNDMAWAVDDKTDRDIAKAIRGGSKMIVKGSSSRGTKTTDTFSLRGSSAAHDAISRECGLTP